jgi:glycosyltransferase involved in cell wall biosynthesis
VTVIGKIAKNRGFEEALQSFAWLRKSRHDVRLMIIGHGEHRGVLETMAHELDVASSVIWAGYHEEELPAHYRASDILFFTAAGSDEGHRAIIEAMACGVAPATFPIPGVSGVLGNLAPDHVARESTPAALAFLGNGLLQRSESERLRFRQAYIARAAEFAYDPSARRLMAVYGLE